ncbi:hypothetical protein TM63_00015 [Salmonella enterica subsp. salamae serovar 42:f,g,t:--]|nr:hypothetical protein TM63_00015 [Salmonella enterica subsp. salamae serovar 42:f,g,t:--]
MKKVAQIYGEIHYIINTSVFRMAKMAISVVVKTKEVSLEQTDYGDQEKQAMIQKKVQDDVILSKRIIVALKVA